MASPRSADPDSRRDDLIAALGQHALAGDQRAARLAIDRLLRGGRAGPLTSPRLADALASTAAAFDRKPIDRVVPQRVSTLRRPIETPPANVITVSEPAHPLLVLPDDLMDRLRQVAAEHRAIDRLASVNLVPTTRLLLTGRPGVGKTLTASWLAAELHRPLARVEPSWVMSSLLGESARNLRQALDWGRRVPCVLLLDEFDAFAKRRDDVTDVGELKRLVNMLLLELDSWPSHSLLVAATNHPQLLDPAMRRRFDMILDLPLPDEMLRRRLLCDLLRYHHQELDPETTGLLIALTSGSTPSELRASVTDSLRRSVISGVPLARSVIEAIRPPMGRDRRSTERRARFCAAAHDAAHMSNRQIASLLAISNAAVSELVHKGRALAAAAPEGDFAGASNNERHER